MIWFRGLAVFAAVVVIGASPAVSLDVADATVPQNPITLASILRSDPAVVSLQGTSQKLRELIPPGDHPVVVSLWATWCAPCRKEVPHLVALSNRFKDAGLIVLGLTMDDEHSARTNVERFLRDQGVSYPVAFASESVYRLFNGEQSDVRLPRVFVFARDGHLVGLFGRYYPRRTNREITTAVEQAVGAPPDSAKGGG